MPGYTLETIYTLRVAAILRLAAQGEVINDMWYVPPKADGWRARARVYSSMPGHKQEVAAVQVQKASAVTADEPRHSDAMWWSSFSRSVLQEASGA